MNKEGVKNLKQPRLKCQNFEVFEFYNFTASNKGCGVNNQVSASKQLNYWIKSN